jgi:hypothetical protein
MPWTERQHCRFESYPTGDGRPSHIYIELNVSAPSLLRHKQIGAVFLALRGNVSWTEADALAKDLNERISRLCANHLAAGE